MDDKHRAFLTEHLPYEIAMLKHTLSRLDNPGLDWNAFMESFCLHARNLKQFFTNDKGKGNNNVVARDFVSSFREDVPPSLTGAFQRLNSQMAHLAKTRTTNEAEKFTITDTRAALAWLEKAMLKFVESLSPQDYQHWASALRGAPTARVEQGQSATHKFLTTQSSTGLFAEMTIVVSSKRAHWSS